jgi:hypothetical protein
VRRVLALLPQGFPRQILSDFDEISDRRIFQSCESGCEA